MENFVSFHVSQPPGLYRVDQEADRLERLGPALEDAGYAFSCASGPRKKHGCVIAYKRDVYEKAFERTVLYDDAAVRLDRQSEQAQRGASFRTRNIGLIVALRRLSDEKEDSAVVVATTHLFWHPKYTYERARQAFILTRSVCEFRNETGMQKAPAFIAGGASASVLN